MEKNFVKQTPFYLIVQILLGCLIFTNKGLASEIDRVLVYSPSMDRSIPVVLIKPDCIKSDSVPTLYLLHGYGGDEETWLKIKPDLGDYVDKYGILIVCPDGENSWYWDSPKVLNSKFETFMTKELYRYITMNYPVEKSRVKTAITGLSMGGHGAFWLASKYPTLYGGVGSMSGGLDLRPFKDSWNLKKHLGPIEEGIWGNYTVATQIEKLLYGDYAILFDCGVADFFYDVNVNMHTLLLEKKIPHDFISRPGVHNSKYWSNAIEYQLLFFFNYFNK